MIWQYGGAQYFRPGLVRDDKFWQLAFVRNTSFGQAVSCIDPGVTRLSVSAGGSDAPDIFAVSVTLYNPLVPS